MARRKNNALYELPEIVVERRGTEETMELLVELYRRRVAWHRAEKTLVLQSRAICRRMCEGDKDAADELYERCAKLNPEEILTAISDGFWEDDYALVATLTELHPLLISRVSIEQQRKRIESALEKLAATLPIAAWIEEIPGVSHLSLAAIIGSAGDLHNYSRIQKLWKRMGLAVIGGQRQRALRDKELALLHGYSPTRRSIMWTIGTAILRTQSLRTEKDEDGAVVGVKKEAGPLRILYDRRRAYENELNESGAYAELAAKRLAEANFDKRTEAYKTLSEGRLTKAHLHARGQRYVEKYFLRRLWREWRKVMPVPVREPEMVISEIAA